MVAQDQLIRLMEADQIECVIIKGAAAAMAYPHPSFRTAGDVDFLVKRADYEKAARSAGLLHMSTRSTTSAA